MNFLTRFGRRKYQAKHAPAAVLAPTGAQAGASEVPPPVPDVSPVVRDIVYVGYLGERSGRHVAGWVHDPARPGHRVELEVYVADERTERVVATGVADQYHRTLSLIAVGDAIHAFRIHLPEILDDATANRLGVRPLGSRTPLQHDPQLRTRWEPITHVALDIVDNCNLRCPFCLYDYEGVNKTNLMSAEAFEQAARLLPLVGPGHFWLSCFHEPTLHPGLLDMIGMIPREFRSNVFFTTNLAKRMPDSYFERLAESGLDHINISIESLRPALYERMRKGARHRIFTENWNKLLAAFARAPAPPKLRYIAMAYKSNLDELPDLVRYLIDEGRAWNVEVRDTYDVPHLPPGFKDSEFLDMDEWRRLHRALSVYPVHQVMMGLPPGFTTELPQTEGARAERASDETVSAGPKLVSIPDHVAEARRARVPGQFEIKMSWNGDMTVMPALAGDYPNHRTDVIRVNIKDIADPAVYFRDLSIAPSA